MTGVSAMKVYLDCGAFKGSIMRQFLRNPAYGPSYKCYAFECNPAMFKIDYGPDVTVIHKALWVHDGVVPLYMNKRHPTIEGHSVYREKITGDLDKEHPVDLPCIDFSAWLTATITPDDYVVCKMNIEGAEYDVLEKCVIDGTIRLIQELHIQWHCGKCKIPVTRHNALVASLVGYPIKVYNGYGHIKAKK
jgi:FkbM family methyltransferase